MRFRPSTLILLLMVVTLMVSCLSNTPYKNPEIVGYELSKVQGLVIMAPRSTAHGAGSVLPVVLDGKKVGQIPGTQYVCIPMTAGRHTLNSALPGAWFAPDPITFELGENEWRLVTVELGRFRLLPDKDLDAGFQSLANCTANRTFDLVVYRAKVLPDYEASVAARKDL